MTEKEAKEIIEISIGCDGPLSRHESGKYMKARGYLDALAKIRSILDEFQCDFKCSPWTSCKYHGCTFATCYCSIKRKKAIDEWEKNK